MPRLRPTRRVAALALALLAVAGLSAASASQLAVDGGAIAAGVSAVGECQPAGQPIRVRFASSFVSGAYRTSAVTFSNVDAACDGLTYRVQLGTAGGAPLDTNGSAGGTDVVGSVSLVSGSFTVPVADLTTAQIGLVSLAITG